MSDEELLKAIRTLAGKIPCILCEIKGGSNVEEDGGCRHRPMVDSPLTDAEVVSRLQRGVEAIKYRLKVSKVLGSIDNG